MEEIFGIADPYGYIVFLCLGIIGVIVLAAVVWGTFAVPEDPSRSGKAPIPVPGAVRLVIELALFAAGTWAFFAADRPLWGLALGILTVIHYALSYDRIVWLLKS